MLYHTIPFNVIPYHTIPGGMTTAMCRSQIYLPYILLHCVPPSLEIYQCTARHYRHSIHKRQWGKVKWFTTPFSSFMYSGIWVFLLVSLRRFATLFYWYRQNWSPNSHWLFIRRKIEYDSPWFTCFIKKEELNKCNFLFAFDQSQRFLLPSIKYLWQRKKNNY